MKKYIYTILILCLAIYTQAQKFSAPSKGYFNNTEKVIVLKSDSTLVTYSFDAESASIDEDIPEVFYLIDETGNKVELKPEEILSLEIARGDEPEDEEGEELNEEDGDESTILVDVIETTEKTDKLFYERVYLDSKKGMGLKGDYNEDYLLLQLASVGMGERLKVYVCPNFENEGTEVAPLGLELDDKVARNRVDFIAYQAFYFVSIDNQPAFRINAEEYEKFGPEIFGDCRPFRRKYSVEKLMDEDKTKTRSKTSRSEVGNKKKKASLLKYQDFAKHVVDYHTLYAEQLAEEEAKRLAKELESGQ